MRNYSFKYFIGIDISKDKFNYAIIDDVMNIIKEGQFDMNAQGFNDFNKVINSYSDSVIALESTGNYHLNLLSFLTVNEHTVCLINPAFIKKFAESITLRKTKTDKIDAIIIAKFILKNIELINSFLPKNMNDITALARIREKISKQISKTKTQFKQHLVVIFPELMVNYNIFTDFILAILEEFPTPGAVIKAPKSKVKGVFNKLAKKGRKPALTYDKFIELAKNSIGVSSSNYALIIKHDVQMLKFLNQQIDEITENFLDEIKRNKKDDLEIIKSIKGISDIT